MNNSVKYALDRVWVQKHSCFPESRCHQNKIRRTWYRVLAWVGFLGKGVGVSLHWPKCGLGIICPTWSGLGSPGEGILVIQA